MKTQLKRKMFSLSLVAMLLVTLCPVSAKATSEYTYTTTDEGTLAITGYSGTDTTLDIPDQIDGTEVTEIADHAFEYNTSIKEVEIPDGVTEIGEASFNDCTNLTEVDLPESLTTIGKDAFFSCTRLAEINFPSSLETLGDGAFYHCASLKSIDVPGSVADFGDYVFGACTSLTEVVLEEGISEVPQQTFYNCQSLTDVTLPQSVEVIGMRAFDQCTRLSSLTLPEHLKRIETRAIDSTGITSLYINAEHIDSKAIGGYVLTSLTLGPDVNDIEPHPFDIFFLQNCQIDEENTSYFTDEKGVIYSMDRTELVFCPPYSPTLDEGYQVPDGVTQIDAYAFYACSSLSSISFPDTLTSIGENAFYTTSIKDLQLPESLTEIGANAFASNYYLTSVTIPSGITELKDGVFSFCAQLSSVTLNDSLTKIGDSAFRSCGNLNQIDLPASLAEVNGSAFDGCGSQAMLTEDSLKRDDSILQEMEEDQTERSEKEKETLNRQIEEYNTALKESNGSSGFTLSVDEQNPYYQLGDDGNLYNKDGDALVFYIFQENESAITIPDTVSTLKPYSLIPSSPTEITISDSVTTIEEKAIPYSGLVTLYGTEGSTIQTYAKENEITFFTGDVQVNASELSLNCKETFQLEVTGIPTDFLVYTSSDNQIASVDQNGLITANANGSVDLYIIDGSYEIHIPVTVSGGSEPDDPYSSYRVFSSSSELKEWEQSYQEYNKNTPLTLADNIDINDYSSNNYIAIKAYLIGGYYIERCNEVFGPGGYEQFGTVTRNLYQEISRFQLNSDLKVYSGTSDISFITGGGSSLKEMVESIGKTVTNPCVISTSLDHNVAAGHGDFMLEIYAPHDLTNSTYINSISDFSSEYELLLNYNLTYKVIDAGIRNITTTPFPDPSGESYTVKEKYIKLLVNPQPDDPDDPDDPVTPDPDTPVTPDQPSKPEVTPSDNSSGNSASSKKKAAKTGDPLDTLPMFALFACSGGLLLIICGNIYRRKDQR